MREKQTRGKETGFFFHECLIKKEEEMAFISLQKDFLFRNVLMSTLMHEGFGIRQPLVSNFCFYISIWVKCKSFTQKLGIQGYILYHFYLVYVHVRRCFLLTGWGPAWGMNFCFVFFLCQDPLMPKQFVQCPSDIKNYDTVCLCCCLFKVPSSISLPHQPRTKNK